MPKERCSFDFVEMICTGSAFHCKKVAFAYVTERVEKVHKICYR